MAKQDNMNSGKRAGGVRHIFAVIGKIVGTILLTAFLTALIFACLFAVYVKNDLSEQAQWASDSFSMEQTSVIYYEDPDTGKYEVDERFDERDLIFYKSVENEGFIEATPGCYSIFFPADVHRPAVAVDEPMTVRKVVVKVSVALLSEE